MKKLLKMTLGSAGLGLMAAPVASQAATTTTSGLSSTDSFGDFATTVYNWSQTGLGIGLAIASILIGAGISVAKNSPMPVLAGIALAAFLHWGPGIAISLLTNGAVFA